MDLRQSLEREEARLNSIRGNIDPAQMEELERIQELLRFWNAQAKSMAWNTETGNGQMVRNADKPHETVLRLVSFEDKDVTGATRFPSTKRELLDMLQVRLVALEDRVEVNAVFTVEPIEHLLCTSS